MPAPGALRAPGWPNQVVLDSPDPPCTPDPALAGSGYPGSGYSRVFPCTPVDAVPPIESGLNWPSTSTLRIGPLDRSAVCPLRPIQGGSAPWIQTFQVTDIQEGPGPPGPGSYPTIGLDPPWADPATGPERPKIQEPRGARRPATHLHPDPARPLEPRGPFLAVPRCRGTRVPAQHCPVVWCTGCTPGALPHTPHGGMG